MGGFLMSGLSSRGLRTCCSPPEMPKLPLSFCMAPSGLIVFFFLKVKTTHPSLTHPISWPGMSFSLSLTTMKHTHNLVSVSSTRMKAP